MPKMSREEEMALCIADLKAQGLAALREARMAVHGSRERPNDWRRHLTNAELLLQAFAKIEDLYEPFEIFQELDQYNKGLVRAAAPMSAADLLMFRE